MTTDLTLFKNNALTMNERFQRMMEDTERIERIGRAKGRASRRECVGIGMAKRGPVLQGGILGPEIARAAWGRLICHLMGRQM